MIRALVFAGLVAPAFAQSPTGTILPGVKVGGSANVRVLSHIPLGGFFKVGDVAIEQEKTRPFAYVAQSLDQAGFAIIDVSDPEHARTLRRWTIERPTQHRGLGGVKPRYFKSGSRYYLLLGTRFTPGSRDDDLAAIIFDVTGLPDASKVREVARLRIANAPGGVHDIFAYKHSDGRALLFAAPNVAHVNIYDLDALVAGRGDAALAGRVPIPAFATPAGGGEAAGYSGIFVGHDPATNQDKFYGAGRGGYFVYDVTRPASAKLLTSVVGAAGVLGGSAITPSPDGRYVVTSAGYQYAPLRLFDLQEGLDGKTQTISRPIGAWTADWRDAARGAEVRWPLVFVSSYEDGLQVFNMVDPKNPQTVGWYYTCLCAHETGFDDVVQARGSTVINGALGVDVRNADGLIAVTDANSGFWLLRLDGFGGWNGADWGMPNVSSAQDWDRGAIPLKTLIP